MRPEPSKLDFKSHLKIVKSLYMCVLKVFIWPMCIFKIPASQYEDSLKI